MYHHLLLPLLLSLSVLLAVDANNSPCAQLSLASSYSVIVVGTGPGGSVVARRLAERNPHWSILSIERGPNYSQCANCSQGNSAASTLAQSDPFTGAQILSTPQPGMNGLPVNVKDPSIEGGASSVNGMEWVRGNAEYFFNTFWPASWNWLSMIPYFVKTETYSYPPGFYGPLPFNYGANLRGNAGPVRVTQNVEGSTYFDASPLVWPNISPNNANGSLNNGFFPGSGAGSTESSIHNGLRSSAYTEYLSPYINSAAGSNLKVITRVRVNKILFAGTTATGVEIVFIDPLTYVSNSTTCTLASSHIISSAGYLGTAKLLKHSGIGPAAELTALGINVVHDLPAVGTNLDDHITFLTVLAGASDPGANGITLWNPQDATSGTPTFQLEPIHVVGGGAYYGILVAHYLNDRGNVTLASSNPDVQPIINPNYFGTASDKANFAVALSEAIQFLKDLGYVLAFDPCAAPNSCPTALDQLNAYINDALWVPGYHFSGTAAICKVVHPDDLTVRGVTGLHVVDASIFPRTGGGNTQATVYAVAERSADQIEAYILATNLLAAASIPVTPSAWPSYCN